MRIVSRLAQAFLGMLSAEKQSLTQAYLDALRLKRSIRRLERVGAPFRTVFDIGAHTGTWATQAARIFPGSDIWLFEANPAMEQALKHTGFPYVISALGGADREADFYSKDGTGDSLYPENTHAYENVEGVRVKVRSLDSIRAERRIPAPDFVKIDVQGAELDVLSGAAETLENARAILSECPVLEYNKGAPSFDQYIAEFRSLGFVPHDLTEVHNLRGMLVQVDVLFVRRDLLETAYPEARKYYQQL